jgi:hypothetical protein
MNPHSASPSLYLQQNKRRRTAWWIIKSRGPPYFMLAHPYPLFTCILHHRAAAHQPLQLEPLSHLPCALETGLPGYCSMVNKIRILTPGKLDWWESEHVPGDFGYDYYSGIFVRYELPSRHLSENSHSFHETNSTKDPVKSMENIGHRRALKTPVAGYPHRFIHIRDKAPVTTGHGSLIVRIIAYHFGDHS